jgi:hypothetical protein
LRGLVAILSFVIAVFGAERSVVHLRLWNESPRLMWGTRADWQRGISISADGTIYGVVATAFPGEPRFGASLIAGANFASSDSRRLSASGTGGENPALIRAASGRLHAAWIDTQQEANFELVAAFSEDGGKTWAEKRLPAGQAAVVSEMVEDSAGRLYLCFSGLAAGEEGNRIFVFSSIDKGESWVAREVNFRDKRGTTGSPQIKAIGEAVVIVWLDQARGGAVVANVSGDGGESWLLDPVVIGKADVLSAPYLEVAITRGQISTFWKLRRGGETSLYRSDSKDMGKSWSPSRRIVKRSVTDITCRVSALGENLWVFWTDERGVGEVETSVHCGSAYGELTQPFEVPMVKESVGNLTGFDVVPHGKGFVIGAIVRSSFNLWKVVARAANPDAKIGDLVEVTSTAGKERNGLLLVDLGREVGFLYQEAEPRRLPMQTMLRDSIVLSRLNFR